MKRFLEWIGIKQKLDTSNYRPPMVSEGDMWWCSIGENIDVEVCGKNERFTRPVVVLKKFGRYSFLCVPVTTRSRQGSWYVSFVHRNISNTAMLNQTRVISYKRLDKRIGTLNKEDFTNIKEAFVRLFYS